MSIDIEILAGLFAGLISGVAIRGALYQRGTAAERRLRFETVEAQRKEKGDVNAGTAFIILFLFILFGICIGVILPS